MKKPIILLLIICILFTMFCLGSCNSTQDEPSLPQKTKQEIELERALELAEEGAWLGAYCLFNDLISRGYYTEYEEKRSALYEDYLIAQAIYQAFHFKNIKENLKNPNSLVIYNINITVEKSKYSDSYYFAITYDYGASNSYGGMVRNTVTSSYSTSEAQKYIGKSINYSHVSLSDVAKLSSKEWDNKLEGDYNLYHYNLRNSYEGNIWR